MFLRWAAATLMGAALFAAACYSPNIGRGGYACGTDGGCPDKFHCASDHRCYQEADASIDMPVVCEADASVPKVCPAPHASGQVCNPGCQTGCSCGWCAVFNGATKCLTEEPGTKDVGTVCTPSLESDCMPGLYCQPECGAGRCYRICDSSDKSVCGTGSKCNVAGNSRGDAGAFSFSLCSIVSACDAVAQTGCPTAFACYPTIPTECDCPGAVADGQGCQLAAQCGRGSSCIGLSTTMSICLQTCRINTDCTTAGTSCKNANPYGYCM
jgi:hypothetical protein